MRLQHRVARRTSRRRRAARECSRSHDRPRTRNSCRCNYESAAGSAAGGQPLRAVPPPVTVRRDVRAGGHRGGGLLLGGHPRGAVPLPVAVGRELALGLDRLGLWLRLGLGAAAGQPRPGRPAPTGCRSTPTCRPARAGARPAPAATGGAARWRGDRLGLGDVPRGSGSATACGLPARLGRRLLGQRGGVHGWSRRSRRRSTSRRPTSAGRRATSGAVVDLGHDPVVSRAGSRSRRPGRCRTREPGSEPESAAVVSDA